MRKSKQFQETRRARGQIYVCVYVCVNTHLHMLETHLHILQTHMHEYSILVAHERLFKPNSFFLSLHFITSVQHPPLQLKNVLSETYNC